MEFRYMGFDQQRNARIFRFDVVAKGETTRHLLISADLALFLTHRIGIQEGPSLGAQKLAADLEKGLEGSHELTEDDMREHAAARALAEARRAEARKTGPRRPTGEVPRGSPWRRNGL